MLLETLFCTGFFLLPLVGMFIMVMVQAMKIGREEEPKHQKCRVPLRKRVSMNPVSIFRYPNTVAYQLIESQTHSASHIKRFKQKIHPRDGP